MRDCNRSVSSRSHHASSPDPHAINIRSPWAFHYCSSYQKFDIIPGYKKLTGYYAGQVPQPPLCQHYFYSNRPGPDGRIAVPYYCGGGYQPPPSHRSREDLRWPHKQSPPVYHSQVRTVRFGTNHSHRSYLLHCRVRSGQTWSCHHPHKVSGHGPSPHNPKDTKVVWRGGSQCALTTSSTRDSDFDTNP